MLASSHCRLKQIQEQAVRQKGMSKGQKRRLAELADDSSDEEGPSGALASEGEAACGRVQCHSP